MFLRDCKDKGSIAILGIIIVAVIVVVFLFLVYTGYIPLSMGDNADNDGMNDPLGSEYCGYSTGDIIGMFKNLMGKDLNNDVGFSVVNAINMKACGTNSKLPSEIISEYTTEFSDGWYIIYDTTTMRTGFYYRTVVWGNTPSIWNATLIKSVISGNGVTVSEWYDYSTITVTSHGSKSGYLAFISWLRS